MAKATQKVFTSQFNADYIDSDGKVSHFLECWDTRRDHSDILLVANAEDLVFSHATVNTDEVKFVLLKESQLNFAAIGEKGIFHRDDE